MNYSLGYLCHLVQTKNDLNRKRRRFYALMHPGFKHVRTWTDTKADPTCDRVDFIWVSLEKPMHYAYSKRDATNGYKKAQSDMKAMTKHMREVRKDLGARFIWSDHGAISYVVHEGNRLNPSAIERMANQHRADLIILGG